MTEHLKVGYRELTPTREGECNGRYTRNLHTPADNRVPLPKVGTFPNKTSAAKLAKAIVLGSTEECPLKRYSLWISLKQLKKPNPQLSRC
jgi:hypothetical protein